MKRPYEKMKMTPVEIEVRERILAGSVMADAPILHESVEVEPFEDDGTFVTSFE